MPPITPNLLALDVGERRVGLAMASGVARLASPLKTLDRSDKFLDELSQIIKDEAIGELVVGLPRNLSGQATAQTRAVEAFVGELKQRFNLPVHLQDEAVTSKQAEAELQARQKPYAKSDIDALAATYILEDFLASRT